MITMAMIRIMIKIPSVIIIMMIVMLEIIMVIMPMYNGNNVMKYWQWYQ